MFSVITNVIVLNLYGKDLRLENDMPKWFENLICIHLARILRMKKINFYYNHTINNENLESDNVESLSESKQNNIDSKQLKKIKESFDFICKEINQTKDMELRELKWKYAALVMDRLFLIISIIYFSIVFISVILSMKNLYKSN